MATAGCMATETEAALTLLRWLSPAFPVGGFAYSHGLEWAVEAGAVRDEATLRDWVAALLADGSGWTDAVLLAEGWRAADDPPRFAAAAALAAALAPSAERRMETLLQGAAFARTLGLLDGAEPEEAEVALPLALGRAAGRAGLPLPLVLPAFLQAFAAALVSAAVRLVPLGQTAGQRVLLALLPDLRAAGLRAEAAALDDLGGAAMLSDIASFRHETQHTRLFRS